MIGWYQCFFAAVILLWLIASPRDRMAAWIILGATVVAELLKYCITIHIFGAWKLGFQSTLEILTIAALLRWSPNRTGYLQAACLSVAWLADVLEYVDVEYGTNFVYDYYVTIIQVVAVAQIAAFYDTAHFNFRRLAGWLGSFRTRHAVRIRSASVRSRLLPDPRSLRDN